MFGIERARASGGCGFSQSGHGHAEPGNLSAGKAELTVRSAKCGFHGNRHRTAVLAELGLPGVQP